MPVDRVLMGEVNISLEMLWAGHEAAKIPTTGCTQDCDFQAGLHHAKRNQKRNRPVVNCHYILLSLQVRMDAPCLDIMISFGLVNGNR
jgi:hypothetical protein